MNLKTGRKPTTVVLKNITDDSDHYPILSDIPLDAISFQRPGPELPAPDRTATLKLPLTKDQLKNYKLGTELNISMAARQLAAELDEVIKQADAALESVAEANRPRCSTKDRLKVIGLSEEQVLHYASVMADMMSKAVEVAHKTCEYTKGGPVPTRRYLKRQHAKTCNCLDEYRACLTQLQHLQHTRGERIQKQMSGLRMSSSLIDVQTARMVKRHKQQLPDVPTCTEEKGVATLDNRVCKAKCTSKRGMQKATS